MSNPFQLGHMENWLQQHHATSIPTKKSKTQPPPKKKPKKAKAKDKTASRPIKSFFVEEKPVLAPVTVLPTPPVKAVPVLPVKVVPVLPVKAVSTTTHGSWLSLAMENDILNFHAAATKEVVSYCQNAKRPPFLLLEGATGSGKSYILTQAARQLHFQMNVLDPWELPPAEDSKKGQRPVFTQQLDMLGFQTYSLDEDTRSSFVVCDAVDAWEKKRLEEFKAWASFLLVSPGGKNAKKRKPSHLRVNPIILTVGNRYDPCVYALFGKTQTAFLHVKVASLDSNKIDSMVRACCEATLVSPTRDLLLQVRQHLTLPDVSSSLTRAEFICRFPTSSRMTRDMLRKDQVVGDDFFGSINQVLRPPEGDWREEISQHWDQGGDRFFRTLFHSYPSFAPWVPSGPKADTKQEEYVEDLELMSQAAELFSRHNLMGEGRGDAEIEDNVLHLGIHQLFQGNIPVTKRPTLDLKTYFPANTPTLRLTSDGIDRVHYAMKMDDFYRAKHSDKANYLDKSYVLESCPFMSEVEMDKVLSLRQKHQQTQQAQKLAQPRALPTGL